MNNDINRIEGIGIIRNKLIYDTCRIYKDNNYNRYIYKSNYYINKENFNSFELKFIKELENVIFKTKKHIKRGHGIQLLPYFMLKNTVLIKTLNNICKNYYYKLSDI